MKKLIVFGLVIVCVALSMPAWAFTVKGGTTNWEIDVEFRNKTTGLPEEDITSATSGFVIYGARAGAAGADLSVGDLAGETTACDGTSDIYQRTGKLGCYRLCVADAVVAAGVDHFTLYGETDDALMSMITVQIVGYTPSDGDDLGLTNLDATVSSRSSHTAANVVDNFETQSQADPTGFHVNVKEVNGTAQTANDNGADINAILEDSGTTIPNQITGLNNLSTSDILGMTVDNDGSAVSLNAFYRLVLAVLTGKTAGSGTSTITFYGVDGTTPRLVMTVSPVGNRTTITTRDGS